MLAVAFRRSQLILIDANTVYIAAAGGGVWKTTNGGTNWTPLSDAQKTLSMGAIALARSNPSVIYAGTGEANNSGDSNYGRGILISTDGGATWTLSTAGGAFDRLTTAQIAVHPTNPQIAYAAMADFGANGLCCTHAGIWKTTDQGVTWTNTTTSITQRAPYSDVQIDPTTSTTVYMAVGNPFFNSVDQAKNGVYKSTDSGTTWNLLSKAPNGVGTGRFAIGISRSNSQILYVSTSDPSFYSVSSVVRSQDGGATFTSITPTNYMGGQGWYDTTLIVDPTNSAIVYVAGSAGPNSILRTSNSGATWADISTGALSPFTSPHVDHHGIAFDANGKLLDGDDGGIYRLDNPTAPSWTDLNGNLETIQFQGIGLHPTDVNKAIGGSQDNGTELFTGSALWTETDGGDGGFASFSPTNGNRVYHQIPVASFGTNFFRRSDDGGNSWVTKTSTISGDTIQNFYAPFVIDPANGDRVLYGTTRVWETMNGGDSWNAISNVGVSGWNPTGANVDSIGLAPSDLNTIYASANGQIFFSSNLGASWTDRSVPLLSSAIIADLEVDPGNSLIAYAVVSTFSSSGNVFRTTNGGTTWTNITSNLPSEPIWSLQIDGTASPSALYIGVDDGVFVSTNLGTSWSRFGMGLPNVQVFEVVLNTHLHVLGAATHGRGMWEIMTPVTKTPTSTSLSSSPNPSAFGQSVTFTATVKALTTGTPTGSVTFQDGTATLGTGTLSSGKATFTTSTLAVGSHSITAAYGGDANFAGSTSAVLKETVTKAATSSTVTSSLNPSKRGNAVTFTATVKSLTTGTPTGSATFKDGATTLGTSILSNGKATLNTSTLAVGSHSITVVYGGDANFTGSTSTVLTQTVNKAGTSDTVTSSLNPSRRGNAVTFTATVKSSTTGTPTGSVTFKDGATTLGTGTLSNGKATFIASTLTVGSHSITTVYVGDGNFTGSTSPALKQKVNP